MTKGCKREFSVSVKNLSGPLLSYYNILMYHMQFIWYSRQVINDKVGNFELDLTNGSNIQVYNCRWRTGNKTEPLG